MPHFCPAWRGFIWASPQLPRGTEQHSGTCVLRSTEAHQCHPVANDAIAPYPALTVRQPPPLLFSCILGNEPVRLWLPPESTSLLSSHTASPQQSSHHSMWPAGRNGYNWAGAWPSGQPCLPQLWRFSAGSQCLAWNSTTFPPIGRSLGCGSQKHLCCRWPNLGIHILVGCHCPHCSDHSLQPAQCCC